MLADDWPTSMPRLRVSRPSPVGLFRAATGTSASLWFKDDGRIVDNYGGNKVRKLGPFLDVAVNSDRRRIVTFGSVGSHHVLATALFGARIGLRVDAFVFAQRETPHVVNVLCATLAQGATLYPSPRRASVHALASAMSRRDTLIVSPGPMGARACTGYADAVHELGRQIESGVIPVPDAIIVPAGSGATAAGILLGLIEARLPSAVVAIAITQNPALRPLILAQAASAAVERGTRWALPYLSARLQVSHRFLGRGYGWPTAAGAEALGVAEEFGWNLEPTYTGKALAAALQLSKDAAWSGKHLLFWQTVSQQPLTTLLKCAPTRAELSADLRALLLPLPQEAPTPQPATPCQS